VKSADSFKDESPVCVSNLKAEKIMQRLGAIFIAICMVVISASVGVILTVKFGLTILEAAPFAVGVLLTLMLIHYQISRVRDRMVIDEQMDDLSRLKLSLTTDLQEVREMSQQLEQSLASRMQGEMEPVHAELDLMGTLVKQLAESCAELDDRVELNEERSKALKHKMDQAIKTMGQIQHSLSNAALAAREKAAKSKQDEASSSIETKSPKAPTDHAAEEADQEIRQSEQKVADARSKAEEASKALEAIAKLHHGQGAKTISDDEKQAVRRALAMGKMELHLQPIVTLPMRKPTFYEMLARLLDERGNIITPDIFLPVCKELNFLPLLDRLAINKAFKMQRSLSDRGHSLPCFCNISLESMADPDFFSHLRELYEQNSDLVDKIILEFRLADLNNFGVMEEETLQLMQSMGFQFSVDQLVNLKADFDRMVRAGVRYAKVAAPILIHREAGRGMDIHPADFSRVLSRKGMNLIVTHVETESTLVNLLDFNIKLAQGNHFAPAKPLRPEDTAPVEKLSKKEAKSEAPAPRPAQTQNKRTLGQNPRVVQALKAMSDQDGGANPTRDHFRNVLAEAAGLMEPPSRQTASAGRSESGAKSLPPPRLQRVIR
jgi:cyclic-di-GMP phosphodiesterase TipF (flagellum assembly factor)